MTIQHAPTSRITNASIDAVPTSWQRLLAVSGVVFAALFLVGWFTTGGLTPHYSAPNHDWTNWARDNQWNGRISGFLMLLAGFVFLHFIGAIRSVLGSAESAVSGSAQLARVAFGGGVTGIAGIAMASVTLAAAGSNGADVDPVVSKAHDRLDVEQRHPVRLVAESILGYCAAPADGRLRVKSPGEGDAVSRLRLRKTAANR